MTPLRVHLDRPATASLRAGVIASGLGLGVQGVLRLTFVLVLARTLGSTAYSDFAFALALSTLGTVAWPASAGVAFSKFVPRARILSAVTDSDGAGRHVIVRTGQFLVLASPAVATGVFWHSEDHLLAVGSAILLIGLSAQVVGRGVHMSLGLSVREAVTQVLTGAAALLTLQSAVWSGMPLSPAAGALILGLCFAAYGLCSFPRGLAHRAASQSLRREVDGFICLGVLGSVASAGLVHLSIAWGATRLPADAAGAYAAAVSVSLPLGLVASATIMVLYPRMAVLTGRGSVNQLRYIQVRSTLTLGAVVLIALWVLGPALPGIVHLVLGPEYRATGELSAVLVLGVAFTAVASPSVAVLSTRANRSLALLSGGAWIGFGCAVVIWAILPPSGMVLASGYVAGAWVTASFAVIGARRATDVSLLFTWALLSAAMAGIVASRLAGLSESFVALVLIAGAAILVVAERRLNPLAVRRGLSSTRPSLCGDSDVL